MKTAEWICTHCGVTNRKLAPEQSSQVVDECVTCHKKHRITEGQRPVRWQAAPVK